MALVSLYLVLSALTGIDAFKPSGHSRSPVNKPYDQKFADRYSPLKYLGGLGPYSSRSGNGISTEVPDGCEVDQVVLLQRHGERYPDVSSVEEHKKVLRKIYTEHLLPFTGDLEFLNDWEYFLESEGDAGLEVMSGPYSGISDLHEKGAIFNSRYGSLWDGQSPVPLFASGSERVIQSARAFGQGFFGYNYTDIAQLNIINESEKAGANALSPYYCALNETTECDVEDPDTFDGVNKIIYPEFDIAALRLNLAHGLTLTGSDIGYLFEIGAFDVSVRGDSPWLDVFTREEWQAYNYRKSLWFHCYFGHGSQIGRANGANWANATTTLLKQGPDGSGLPLVFNFAHDSDITSFLGGMNILHPLKPVTPDQVTFDTRWDISDIAPMGAQLVIERLKCNAPGLTNDTNLINYHDSIPDSYLNNTFGIASLIDNLTSSYFSPVTQNSIFNTTTYYPNASVVPYSNETIVTPVGNMTLLVTNSTNGSVAVQNVTSVFGFNATEGVSDNDPIEESIFVRILLNDAVVPLDDCYDGPGYSCSLDDWVTKVEDQVYQNSYVDTCLPANASLPTYVDFYWNYNHTTAEDTASYIPWQGGSLM